MSRAASRASQLSMYKNTTPNQPLVTRETESDWDAQTAANTKKNSLMGQRPTMSDMGTGEAANLLAPIPEFDPRLEQSHSGGGIAQMKGQSKASIEVDEEESCGGMEITVDKDTQSTE